MICAKRSLGRMSSLRKKTEKHPNARPIDTLAADVRALLVANLPKADYFALQLDAIKSTDVSNDTQLFL